MVAIRRVDRHVGAVGIGCLRLVCNGTGAAARSGIGPIVERHVLQPFARERLAQLLLIGEVVASIMQSRPVAVATECDIGGMVVERSDEHTSELQSLMRHSYAV